MTVCLDLCYHPHAAKILYVGHFINATQNNDTVKSMRSIASFMPLIFLMPGKTILSENLYIMECYKLEF